jgi:mannose-6-phosphate isomerase-like protein (cupin superfamily)
MAETQHKRGISIYPASEAKAKTDTEFTKLSDEQLAALTMAAEPMRLGLESRVLVTDAAGFSLTHLWVKPNFPLPRHNHTPGDCLYYVISGSSQMGNRTIGAGDSFLVPSGAPYQYTAGPDGMEVLEIRYGTHQVDMNILEGAERYQKRAAAALDANRELWSNDAGAPTFAKSR